MMHEENTVHTMIYMYDELSGRADVKDRNLGPSVTGMKVALTTALGGGTSG